VTAPGLGAALTRTVVARDHALIAPEGHVAVTLPGWSGASAAALVAPAMGAQFSMSIAHLDGGGRVGAPRSQVSRFVFVLDGSVRLTVGGDETELVAGGYAFVPSHVGHEFAATSPARVCLIEKPYVPAGESSPEVVIGSQHDVPVSPLPGADGVEVRELIPADPAYDLAVNVMEYAPGAALPFVESHVMEHGLLMLDGSMVYRLGSAWYPVAAEDAIWMAPYCPQWCCAFGSGPARYLIYKDWNRDPLA
jgi:(S)-ureidoglycine aminohydrolase